MDSRFFDADQRVKNVPAPPNAPVPITPSAAPTPAVSTFTPATVAAPSLLLSDLLLANLFSQSGGLGTLFSGLNQPSHTALAPVPIPAPSGPCTAPPSPVKRHSVTTDQFWDVYNIDEVDCTRLKDLGFRPRDTTDSKVDNDLKEAGFTVFSWKRIHEANTRFKADLAAGLYDA